MTDDLPATHETSNSRPSPAATCRYCGARLNLRYYFCVACATPYKDMDTVVPQGRPPQLTEGERVQLQAPGAAPLFWTYFTVAIATSVISAYVFGPEANAEAMLFADTVALVVTCIFAAMYWRSLSAQFRRPGFDHAEAWIALALLAPALGVNYLYFAFLTDVAGFETMSLGDLLADLGPVGAVLLFCLYPAVTEEIAFRGLLQHWLHVTTRPSRAIVIASLLFAALHFSIPSLPYLFAFGCLLGWVKWKTGSLYPAMLIHFLHNLVVIEFML